MIGPRNIAEILASALQPTVVTGFAMLQKFRVQQAPERPLTLVVYLPQIFFRVPAMSLSE